MDKYRKRIVGLWIQRYFGRFPSLIRQMNFVGTSNEVLGFMRKGAVLNVRYV